MYLLRRAVIFIVGCAIALAAHAWFDGVASPQQAAQVAVASLNGGDSDAARARLFGAYRSGADEAAVGSVAVLAAACFGPMLIRARARGRRGSGANS
jgi:hypothetical protein